MCMASPAKSSGALQPGETPGFRGFPHCVLGRRSCVRPHLQELFKWEVAEITISVRGFRVQIFLRSAKNLPLRGLRNCSAKGAIRN